MRNDPWIPRPDTGNFNKFLTSLGLLLLGSSLVIPYFYFGNSETLSIPAHDLSEMTKTGRQALLSRQEAIAAIEPWVVASAVMLAVAGLVLLVVGALRLRSAQEMEDEESDLRRRRARLEVDEMSPAEQEQKNVERAKTEVAEEGMAKTAEALSVTRPEAPVEAEAMPRVVRPDWQTNWSSRVAVISRISRRVNDAFEDLDAALYEFKWQVRIGAPGEEIRLDALFESKVYERPDVILSNRLIADPKNLRGDARNRANDMIALISRYEALTRRPAKGWIVYVLPEESDADLGSDSTDAIAPLRREFAAFGQASILREAELDSLPVLFKRLFRA